MHVQKIARCNAVNPKCQHQLYNRSVYYRVSRQKEYTFDDLLGGRSARYCAAQYGKLTAHSSSFERGALELDMTILGHYRSNFLQKSISRVI